MRIYVKSSKNKSINILLEKSKVVQDKIIYYSICIKDII